MIGFLVSCKIPSSTILRILDWIAEMFDATFVNDERKEGVPLSEYRAYFERFFDVSGRRFDLNDDENKPSI